MKVFNIYYKEKYMENLKKFYADYPFLTKPLTIYEVNGIKEKNFILKKDKDNRIVKIPLENVKIIKCTLI